MANSPSEALLQALLFSVRRKTGQAKEDQMPYQMKPLSCDPTPIKGMSERLIVSHYENNYGGAVNRLNAITAQLAELDFAKTPRLRDQRAQAGGADRQKLDDPARALLRLARR